MATYTTMDAQFATMFIVVATMLITPFYVLATYVASGASARKGMIIGAVFAAWGALMVWVCLSELPRKLGLPGTLIIPAAWIFPSLIVFLNRRWFLAEPLSQRWLVGLQLFRAGGGVFLIEMARGNIPGSFAYPAGLGDIAVALVALWVLWTQRVRASLSRRTVYAVIVLGVIDFVSAFFFGFTSSDNPLQLFAHGFENQLLLFPTGLIPLFLVPYAIFFHTLSFLSLRQSGEPTDGEMPT